MNVLVVEDHGLVRRGLCMMLRSLDKFEACIECSSLSEALSEAEKAADSLGLVMMDLSLPDAEGLQSLELFHRDYPEVPVLIVSGTADGGIIDKAFAKGARGYLPKNSGPKSLGLAIEAVLAGEYYVPPHILSKGLIPRAPSEPEAAAPASSQLTRRQSQVLLRLARGLANKEIAQELGISPLTVRVHVTSILRELGVENRTQAAMSPEAKRLLAS